MFADPTRATFSTSRKAPVPIRPHVARAAPHSIGQENNLFALKRRKLIHSKNEIESLRPTFDLAYIAQHKTLE